MKLQSDFIFKLKYIIFVNYIYQEKDHLELACANHISALFLHKWCLHNYLLCFHIEIYFQMPGYKWTLIHSCDVAVLHRSRRGILSTLCTCQGQHTISFPNGKLLIAKFSWVPKVIFKKEIDLHFYWYSVEMRSICCQIWTNKPWKNGKEKKQIYRTTTLYKAFYRSFTFTF